MHFNISDPLPVDHHQLQSGSALSPAATRPPGSVGGQKGPGSLRGAPGRLVTHVRASRFVEPTNQSAGPAEHVRPRGPEDSHVDFISPTFGCKRQFILAALLKVYCEVYRCDSAFRTPTWTLWTPSQEESHSIWTPQTSEDLLGNVPAGGNGSVSGGLRGHNSHAEDSEDSGDLEDSGD